MSVTVNDKNLGHATAYAYAKSKGYTGTEEEFAELMANFAEVAEEARGYADDAQASAEDAERFANNASASANTATTKAGEASQSATNAQQSATNANQSATQASGSATTAQGAVQTATAKANEASASAATALQQAQNAMTHASNAQTFANNAQTSATQAAASANTANDSANLAVEAAEEATTTVANKADKDGIYSDLSVGNVFSDDSYTEDQTPYLYRVSGGVEVGKVEADTIVGGTVAFNQLAHELNDDGWRSEAGVTATYADGVATVSSTTAGNGLVQQTNSPVVKGNKYLVTADFKADEALSNVRFGASTSSGLFLNVNVSTQWATYSLVGESLINTGTVFIYHTGSAYSNLSVRNAMLIDLTQMFGTAIADYIYSLETATAGAGVAVFRKMFPSAYYPYNAGELMHVSGVSEHVMTGKNLNPNEGVNYTTNDSQRFFMRAGNYVFSTDNGAVIDGTNAVYIQLQNEDGTVITKGGITSTSMQLNGTELYYFGGQFNSECAFTLNYDAYVLIGFNNQKPTNFNALQIELGVRATAYEPYREPYRYPLDSSLTLRGIPKLDSANNLYYDGDTYASDGTVTRKYGIVDLGSLTWEAWTGYAGVYRTPLPSNCKTMPNNNTLPNWIAPIYKTVIGTDISSNNKTIGQLHQTYLVVHDDSYSTASDFKTAMNGVYLVYELATPTTETAEPYEEYQHVTNGGTEEYVSTGIVPVGHNTKYYGDIGSKVDKLPSDFSNIIAPTESAFKATRAYTVNDLIIIDNVLYKVTASIASGATITPNTNVQQTTLSALIKALSA